MKKICLLSSMLFLCLSAFAQTSYRYVLNLTEVKEDKVQVGLINPKIRDKESVFYLPKIIPGTYAIADYGRYVSDLKAYDKKGRLLDVERLDVNSWKISKAKKLRKLTYLVADTYNTEMEGPEIFQPAGTNIVADENFIINSSGFFGYFEGMKNLPFELNIVRDSSMYGATGLMYQQQGIAIDPEFTEWMLPAPGAYGLMDVFATDDYDHLIDSPIMYSAPDTVVMEVANAQVLVAAYSPNSQISAQEIAVTISDVLEAQSTFLGGKLPVEKYAFIFYFTDQPVMSYGALEHSYSSFYFIPEAPIQQLAQTIRDFAAHEFFHIVTPLTIHSEEIARFDFNDPKMSRHLWLYEGMTEYFAGLVQVKYGLISPDAYFAELRQKMMTAEQFKDTLPFTELSLGALDEHEDQYYNVYMKGALIGMALDIRLLELSDGKYGTQELARDLGQKYGKDRPFKDDELFDAITELTYPEIRQFFADYVEGEKPLPYEEIFGKVGIRYLPEMTTQNLSIGITNRDITLAEHEGNQYLGIRDGGSLNAQGKALGLATGDIITGMNGLDMPAIGPDLGTFIQQQQANLPNLAEVSYTVMRRNEEGQMDTLVLAAKAIEVEEQQTNVLLPMEEPTEAQLQLREQWLSAE